jgi:hypothetical protein
LSCAAARTKYVHIFLSNTAMGSPADEETAVSPGAARAVEAEQGDAEERRESMELNPV